MPAGGIRSSSRANDQHLADRLTPAEKSLLREAFFGFGASVCPSQKIVRPSPISVTDGGELLSPADGEATVCGLFVETNDATGLALRVEPVRQGGRLSQAMPVA